MENLSGNLKMYVESDVQININNLTISGEKKREIQNLVGKNATIMHNAPIIMINGAECTKEGLISAYNLFEQPWSSSSKSITKFVAKNCKLNTSKAVHNIFNLYKFEEGATVEFDNCEFVLNPMGNVVRFDNLTDVKSVLIVFNNCKWNYDPEASEQDYINAKKWLSLMGFENAMIKNKAVFGNWKVVVNNCGYNGEPIKPEYGSYLEMTTENQEGKHSEGSAIMWVYDDGTGFMNPEKNPEYFPQVTVINGQNKKIYRA